MAERNVSLLEDSVTGLKTSNGIKVPSVTGGVSTDNAIVRFDGTSGKVQNSGVIIDDAGNVGVGVTPGAWVSGVKVLQIGATASIANNNANATELIHNNCNGRYQISGQEASSFSQINGYFIWSTAPAGTAGQPITRTDAMKLNSNGNLLVGTTTDNLKHKVQVNGKITSTITGNYSSTQGIRSEDASLSSATQEIPSYSTSFTPIVGGGSVISGGVGYSSHNILGSWRNGVGGWHSGHIGTFITPGGGDDSFSTTYYLLKDNGQIGWSGGTPTLVSLSDMRKKIKKKI